MYLGFLFASVAISIGLQMVLSFPYGLGIALAIFIAFPLFLRRKMMGRMGGSGGFGGGFFGTGQKSYSNLQARALLNLLDESELFQHN